MFASFDMRPDDRWDETATRPKKEPEVGDADTNAGVAGDVDRLRQASARAA
jgi:hypothetical protein